MGLRRDIWRRVGAALALGAATFMGLLTAIDTAAGADPIRIGLSLSITGPTSPAGKQVLAGLEIWRDDVNAKGGVLGRPVQLVYYDDQGSPANAPGIYAKLMGVDKVDLLIGPYSTNVVAASLPAIIQAKRTTIGIFALGANKAFSLQFAGTKEMMAEYQKRAPGLGIDPLGFTYPPYAYAAGQILARAVAETKSLNDEVLAAYMHRTAFDTVIGPIAFGPDGEWTTPRIICSQFQGITGGDLAQFQDWKRQVVVYPREYKAGSLIYPFEKAR